MKKNYTIIFSLNNLNEAENYSLDLSEIIENEEIVKKVIDKIEYVPNPKVVDQILKFARNNKI
jgi:hypothetical protein